MSHRPAFQLLLAGSGTRLLIVAAVIVALWAGFFWATAPPGSL